jgi:hypothetical protein
MVVLSDCSQDRVKLVHWYYGNLTANYTDLTALASSGNMNA